MLDSEKIECHAVGCRKQGLRHATSLESPGISMLRRQKDRCIVTSASAEMTSDHDLEFSAESGKREAGQALRLVDQTLRGIVKCAAGY